MLQEGSHGHPNNGSTNGSSSPLAGHNDKRHTRYSIHRKNGPPKLGAVIRQLRAQNQKAGGIQDVNMARGLCAAASHQDYSDPGPADDLVRFLENHHVLFRVQEGGFLFDSVRADEVIAACDGGVPLRPRSKTDIERRIKELQAEHTARTEIVIQVLPSAHCPPGAPLPDTLAILVRKPEQINHLGDKELASYFADLVGGLSLVQELLSTAQGEIQARVNALNLKIEAIKTIRGQAEAQLKTIDERRQALRTELEQLAKDEQAARLARAEAENELNSTTAELKRLNQALSTG